MRYKPEASVCITFGKLSQDEFDAVLGLPVVVNKRSSAPVWHQLRDVNINLVLQSAWLRLLLGCQGLTLKPRTCEMFL